LNIILTHTHQKKKIHDNLFNFTGKIQKWMRPKSLDELRAVIDLLIYGGVFESSHEHIESLYKMDGTGRLLFPVVMAKNRLQFLLSIIRFDEKATRTERRLEDKMAALREIWDMFIGLCKSLYLVGSAVRIDEHLLPFRGRCGFRQYMPNKMCGLVSESEENIMQGPEDYKAISRKRGRCHVCSRSRDVKTQFVCKGCGHYVCKDHMSMIVTCDTCKNKDETDESD